MKHVKNMSHGQQSTMYFIISFLFYLSGISCLAFLSFECFNSSHKYFVALIYYPAFETLFAIKDPKIRRSQHVFRGSAQRWQETRRDHWSRCCWNGRSPLSTRFSFIPFALLSSQRQPVMRRHSRPVPRQVQSYCHRGHVCYWRSSYINIPR